LSLGDNFALDVFTVHTGEVFHIVCRLFIFSLCVSYTSECQIENLVCVLIFKFKTYDLELLILRS
jgi:hypothetical protein